MPSYSKNISYITILALFTLMCIGCSPEAGSLFINNDTGHNDLYISTNLGKKGYIANGDYLSVDVTNGQSVTVTASKIERDASGIITWDYYYKGQVRASWDPQNFFGQIGMGSDIFSLTPQMNQH